MRKIRRKSGTIARISNGGRIIKKHAEFFWNILRCLYYIVKSHSYHFANWETRLSLLLVTSLQLTFPWSALAFVESRWTLQTLLNMAPNARVKPIDIVHALAWQIITNCHGVTNLPSIPMHNTAKKQPIIPTSIIVLALGWDEYMTLKSRHCIYRL